MPRVRTLLHAGRRDRGRPLSEVSLMANGDWECVRCGRTNIGPYAKTPLGKMSTGCFLMASKNDEFESQSSLSDYRSVAD